MSARRTDLPDFGPAIALFRDIAARSGDALLTEGPVHPDHELLALCATALHHLAYAQTVQDSRRQLNAALVCGPDENRAAAAAEDKRRYNEFMTHEALGQPYLRRIAGRKATTPAGIYAKAAVVRASKTGAAGLAMSLARDLLDCPELRGLLWPAGREDAT